MGSASLGTEQGKNGCKTTYSGEERKRNINLEMLHQSSVKLALCRNGACVLDIAKCIYPPATWPIPGRAPKSSQPIKAKGLTGDFAIAMGKWSSLLLDLVVMTETSSNSAKAEKWAGWEGSWIKRQQMEILHPGPHCYPWVGLVAISASAASWDSLIYSLDDSVAALWSGLVGSLTPFHRWRKGCFIVSISQATPSSFQFIINDKVMIPA